MPPSKPHRLAPLLRRLAWVALLGVACPAAALGLFEILYRWQILDTYAPELKAWNDPATLAGGDGRLTALLLGDSFTAGPSSYPALLRPQMPDLRIINAGIPSTGIVEAQAVAPGWFERFRPSILVYQIYIGNDLFNLTCTTGGQGGSLPRRLYWWVTRRLRGVGFLNYRAGQIVGSWRAGAGGPGPPGAPEAGPFEPARYNTHERLYIQANPWFLEEQITLQGRRRGEFDDLLERLDDLLSLCREPACRAFILVIPHAAQVHPRYAGNMKVLGARFRDEAAVLGGESPFAAGLRAFLVRRGMRTDRLIDPLAGLRDSESAGQPVYYLHDPHLNERGQQLVAEAVRERLVSLPEAGQASPP